MRLSKKIFIFSSIALIIILFFWGIYALVYRQPTDSKNEKNISAENSLSEKISVPASPAEEIIQPLTDEAVLAPILSTTGKSIKYYTKNTGESFELDTLSLKKTLLSSANLEGLLNVLWSPDTTKVLSEFYVSPDRSRFSFYDYKRMKGAALNETIETAVWQNNTKIVYQYLSSINIADPDGSNWVKVTDLPFANTTISPIPMSGLISFWNKPDAFSETLLQSTSVINGEKKTLIQGYFGADYLWSPDGSLILESNTDQKGGSKLNLGLTNGSGEEYKSLNIPTLVSKCVWSKNNDFVYYALPTTLPDGAVMPNDYLEGKFTTNDTFWKVNVKTGEKTRLVELPDIKNSYDAASLFLNLDESMLFFINKIDGKLYRILL